MIEKVNGRIILVGPTCSGKTYLRNRLEKKGFVCDVSYTSRPPRPGEVDGVHYHFITKKAFQDMIMMDLFYEHVEYNGNYYGTGQKEWDELSLFIMETDGVKHITPEDRKSCFVIYVLPPMMVRQARMADERAWSDEEIAKRTKTDIEKFNGFDDFDMILRDPEF